MLDFIQHEIKKTRLILEKIENQPELLKMVCTIAEQCTAVLRAGGKIFFAGNGGSAADSQHLAAELVSRLRYNRPGLAGIALTTDTSALTAIGNDYSFEDLFSRQIEALGQSNDALIGFSTSGRSPNILKALKTAREKNMLTIGFTGLCAPLMQEQCDLVLNIPSSETPKIQECHILLGHIVCALIEESIYGEEYSPYKNAVGQ